MPMELRKRKAPTAPAAPAPAPKRKASAKKGKAAEPEAAAPKAAETKAPATIVKKVALPKKSKPADKAEVTTEPPSAADPEVLPEAPPAEASKAKPAAKAKPAKEPKEAKETKATKAAETSKKEDKPAAKEKKATPAAKEKKEKAAPVEKAAEKTAEKKVPVSKAKKDKAPVEAEASTESKPVEEKKKETDASDKKEKTPAEKKEKKAVPTKGSTSKSATSTPAPASSVDLKQGDPIPTGLPELSNHAGEKVTLSSLLDASTTGIVLFAYPAASTPGCIKQARFFNTSKEDFEAEGYSVYGLSGDKPEKNLKFKEKEKLTYPLLSDITYELHQKFGIAKGSKGTLRSVVVISKDGAIVALKKAGPEETVKIARSACGLPSEDAKLKKAEKSENEKEKEADVASKQPTVEEAPDSTA